MSARKSGGIPAVLRGPLFLAFIVGIWLFYQNITRGRKLGIFSSGEVEVPSLESLRGSVARNAQSELDEREKELLFEVAELKKDVRRILLSRRGDTVMVGDFPLTRLVHYEADYDLTKLKPAPPLYAYGSNPAFRYPPDVPTFPKDIAYRIVSHQPMLFYFPQLIPPEVADGMVVEAEGKLSRSQVGVDKENKEGGAISDERTSEGCWLSDADKNAKKLRTRIREVTGFPARDFELTQVLRYSSKQKYNQHLDWIDPAWHSDGLLIDSQRAATLLIFLADMPIDAGGETVLPMANGGPPAPGYGLTCGRGLRVRPRKGAAILVYDMTPDKTMDPYSLHGACPVKKGQKFVAVQWLRVAGLWDKAHGLKAVH
eukprot:Hpha_TRINITY_DN34944_c0_g1::TRINITY_DN34944_c0_g1_i1::g.184122::m.184122/K00472/P4HA; prolyl 4-hydroxylase